MRSSALLNLQDFLSHQASEISTHTEKPAVLPRAGGEFLDGYGTRVKHVHRRTKRMNCIFHAGYF